MRFGKLIIAAAAAASLTGCGTRRVQDPAQQLGIQPVVPAVEEFRLPAVGATATAAVGASMVSVAKVNVAQVIELPEALSVVRPYAHDPAYTYHFTIPAGTYKLAATDVVGAQYFTFGPQLVSWVTGGKLSHSERAVADFKLTREGAPHFAWAIQGSGELFTVSLSAPRFNRSTRQEPTAGGFRRELVYSGVSQGTVGILYREFIDDMARPAFSQDLRYDLAQGNLIGYQGARFEVLKADNTGITYRVLSHLDASR
jgi:hypothetical protein